MPIGIILWQKFSSFCFISSSVMAYKQLAQVSTDMDAQWVLSSAFLVIFMQTGFAMLEAGTVSSANIQNILFKNFLDMCIGAMMFFLIGHGIACSPTSLWGFMGVSDFAVVDSYQYPLFFFQYTFSSAAATIVSGAVAGRCKIEAYFIYSVVISGFIYPVVAHWVWSADGWLAKMGIIDFAGSGVVHCTGGMIALVGAVLIGPRLSRFKANSDGSLGEPRSLQPNNVLMLSLGVFILWFGWYGFNCGSTLQLSEGKVFLAARVATTTTLSASASTILSVPIGFVRHGHYNLPYSLNSAVAGLVSITAGCATVSPASSLIIGSLGAVFYTMSSALLMHLRIDDPLDASSVHLCCGVWGVLAAGIFGADASFHQFYVQLLGVVCILCWAGMWAALTFKLCLHTVGLRVSAEVEIEGIDSHEHGGSAVTIVTTWSLDDVLERRGLRDALLEFMKLSYSQESLEFLIDCQEIFSSLGMDTRMKYLLEDKDCLEPSGPIKRVAGDLCIDLFDKFLVVGADKEINIGATLSKRIAKCFTDNETTSCDVTASKSKPTSSRRVFFGSAVVACDTTVLPSIGEEGKNLTTVSVRSELTTKGPSSFLSMEVVQCLVEAYVVAHKLVLDNSFGGFCQTPAFTKASKRYST